MGPAAVLKVEIEREALTSRFWRDRRPHPPGQARGCNPHGLGALCHRGCGAQGAPSPLSATEAYKKALLSAKSLPVDQGRRVYPGTVRVHWHCGCDRSCVKVAHHGGRFHRQSEAEIGMTQISEVPWLVPTSSGQLPAEHQNYTDFASVVSSARNKATPPAFLHPETRSRKGDGPRA